MNFEITLRMIASRANIGGFFAYHDMTAVAAFPHFDRAFFKDLSSFDIFEQSTVSFLVMLFDCGNKAESARKFRESLFFCSFGKSLVHIRPFIVFACGSRAKILRRISDAVKFLKPKFCVFFFIFSRF